MNFKTISILLAMTVFGNSANADDKRSDKELSFYTGQFDITDEVGDDETTLFGIEHKNPNLFRNTFLGKFSPITGAFITDTGSAYLYTGVQGQYNLGP